MVNKETLADLGSRMDLDPCKEACQLTDETGQEIEAYIIAKIGKAMRNQNV
jgi:hypothetical protein